MTLLFQRLKKPDKQEGTKELNSLVTCHLMQNAMIAET